jgi:hypothetical protein
MKTKNKNQEKVLMTKIRKIEQEKNTNVFNGAIIVSLVITLTLICGYHFIFHVDFNSTENQTETETTEIFKYKCNENKIHWSSQVCFGDECWVTDRQPIQHCEEHYYEKEVIIKK